MYILAHHYNIFLQTRSWLYWLLSHSLPPWSASTRGRVPVTLTYGPIPSFINTRQDATLGRREFLTQRTASNILFHMVTLNHMNISQESPPKPIPSSASLSRSQKCLCLLQCHPMWGEAWEEVRRERHNGPNRLYLKYLTFANFTKMTAIQIQCLGRRVHRGAGWSLVCFLVNCFWLHGIVAVVEECSDHRIPPL